MPDPSTQIAKFCTAGQGASVPADWQFPDRMTAPVTWPPGPKVSSDDEFDREDSDNAQRVDLLTAILHEMGHLLGLEHRAESDSLDSLMDDILGVGVRRLPTSNLVDAVLSDRD